MSNYLAYEACEVALQQTANFLGAARNLGCDALTVTPSATGRPKVELGLGSLDQDILAAIGGVPVTHSFSEVDLLVNITKSKRRLRANRPEAGIAIDALKSVAVNLPSQIEAMRGFLLDARVATAPKLEIDCTVDKVTVDALHEFIEGSSHIRDSLEGAPFIHTEYTNYLGEPIGVKLNLKSVL